MGKAHIVVGKQAVYQTLKSAKERVLRLFVARGVDDEGLEKLASPLKISYTNKDFIEKISGTKFHQGLALEVRDRPFHTLQDAIEQEECFIVALDSITDPQNMGAIFRCAECFGVDYLLWSKNRGADLTPSVAKVSCGATEIVNRIRINNLHDALSKLQKEGFAIVLADCGEGAKNLMSYTYPRRCVLIMGSEGEGARPLIKKVADERLTIPMQGAIQSLNVSQALSIFLSRRLEKS